MAGTKEIRNQIVSVKSTQKITKAMQMGRDQQDASRPGTHEAGASVMPRRSAT